jgi:hypothetical protein
VEESAANHHRLARKSWLAWILCGLISLFTLINYSLAWKSQPETGSFIKLAGDFAFIAFPIVSAVVAALIASRQPRNTIGWLLMSPAIVIALPVDSYLNRFTSAPPTPGPLLLLALWYNNWSWLLYIFPILFILLLFPTGRPMTPRWRWPIALGLGLCAFLIFFATFSTGLSPSGGGLEGAWRIPNPIGFLNGDAFPFPIWGIALGIFTISCAASLFVRYRRASAVEREQIKWLLYAGSIFVLLYIPGLVWLGNFQGLTGDLVNLLLPIATLLFPIAIAIAILRYRLWDIDVIIRKTLIYSVLTAILAMVFLGCVLLLQQLFGGLTGTQNSPFVIVLSTLAIAALFTPLRRRLQDLIDRRFFRKKFNAQKILERFAISARDEMEMEQLTADLLSVVEETLQPDRVSLWLQAGKKG